MSVLRRSVLFGTWPSPRAFLAGITALIILLGLGTWQVRRLHWKLGLIAEMKARMSAPATALPPGSRIDAHAWAYRRVAATGHYVNSKEMHLLSYNQKGVLGYDLVTPLVRDGGQGVVLVNRGWVPRDRAAAADRPGSEVTGRVRVIGIVHPAWKGGLFTPQNEPAHNRWFAGDTAAMAEAAGIGAVPPLLIDRVVGQDPDALPIGGQTRVDLPNHHLQYAITWYLLAVVLVVIFVRYHHRLAAEGASMAAASRDGKGMNEAGAIKGSGDE